MIRSLPASLRPEHGTGFLEPTVERRETAWPTRQISIERVTQPVVIRIGLPRQPGGETRVAIRVAEPPCPVRTDIDARVTGRDPASQCPPDAAARAEPVERQPGRDPETANPGERTQERVRIGGHGVRVADQSDRFGIGEEREPSHGASHERGETFPVGRERAGGMLPRDTILPP